MKAEELIKFLETLPGQTEVLVSVVLPDDTATRLEIESVLMSNVLPAKIPMPTQTGSVYLCTWKPCFDCTLLKPVGEHLKQFPRKIKIRKPKSGQSE